MHGFLRSDAEEGRYNTIDFFVRVLFFIWVLLLIPWVVIAPLSGMALDGGDTWSARLFIASTWSYGIAVFAAFKLLDHSRKAVLLPLLSLAGMFFFRFP